MSKLKMFKINNNIALLFIGTLVGCYKYDFWVIMLLGWLCALIGSIGRPIGFYLNYPYESL